MRALLLVEGYTDVPVAEKLARWAGLTPGKPVVTGGKSKLDPRIPEIAKSNTHIGWLILRDLDRDEDCAPALLRRLLGHVPLSPWMGLRVPVRAMESWLLADADAFADIFSVPKNRMPTEPDSLYDPKRFLVDLCRQSRRREIRYAMAPRQGGGRSVGPEYSSRIEEFARSAWDAQRASGRSASLLRAKAALGRLADGASRA